MPTVAACPHPQADVGSCRRHCLQNGSCSEELRITHDLLSPNSHLVLGLTSPQPSRRPQGRRAPRARALRLATHHPVVPLEVIPLQAEPSPRLNPGRNLFCLLYIVTRAALLRPIGIDLALFYWF